MIDSLLLSLNRNSCSSLFLPSSSLLLRPVWFTCPNNYDQTNILKIYLFTITDDYGYGGGSYYNNHYAPIYSINTGGQGHGKKNQGGNNVIIRNSYSTGYGGQKGYNKGGYGGDSYGHNNGYNKQYSNCISSLGNSGGKKNNKHGNDNDLLMLLLGGGCGGGLLGGN